MHQKISGIRMVSPPSSFADAAKWSCIFNVWPVFIPFKIVILLRETTATECDCNGARVAKMHPSSFEMRENRKWVDGSAYLMMMLMIMSLCDITTAIIEGNRNTKHSKLFMRRNAWKCKTKNGMKSPSIILLVWCSLPPNRINGYLPIGFNRKKRFALNAKCSHLMAFTLLVC